MDETEKSGQGSPARGGGDRVAVGERSGWGGTGSAMEEVASGGSDEELLVPELLLFCGVTRVLMAAVEHEGDTDGLWMTFQGGAGAVVAGRDVNDRKDDSWTAAAGGGDSAAVTRRAFGLFQGGSDVIANMAFTTQLLKT